MTAYNTPGEAIMGTRHTALTGTRRVYIPILIQEHDGRWYSLGSASSTPEASELLTARGYRGAKVVIAKDDAGWLYYTVNTKPEPAEPLGFTFSDLKEIRALLIDDADNLREFIENARSGLNSFTVDEYLFCRDEDVARNMIIEQLDSDAYHMGCCSPMALADVTGLDPDVFTILHDAEAFEAAGKIVIAMDKVADLADICIAWDGAGHMLSCYDGEEIELGNGWLAYRN